MSESLVYAAVAAIFILVGGLWWYFRQKRLKDAWEGTLADKKVITTHDNEGDAYQTYWLYVTTSEGQKKISVSNKLYDSFAIGDKLVKRSGEMNPVKA